MQFRCHKMLCYVMLCYVMLCYVMFTWREEDPRRRIILAPLDLLQVDLLASGASLVWPRSGRLRATKSREVVPRHMKSDEGLF